ncbi:tetratricopeptide repeat protein [Cobetia sp. 3AK]|uniref:tetratricopeptide repeat protein n=1 Tax=Cobetia sp. 3AK TaxID=3040020 RepID=UPI002447E80B|nr:tetratricopeptide repeat protein [Cobetia sp. 3AK]MDH2375426.1 tetratricopeptide repeat protein [Cobetia sp. 3AK]
MFILVLLTLCVLPTIANAESLFQDPTGEDFYDKISSYKTEDISCLPDCNEDNYEKKYIRAVLSLSGGNERLNIKESCNDSVNSLKKMWEAGLNDAGYNLSRMYYEGVCGEVNLSRSEDLLFKTAENGYVPAQKLLGKSYWRQEIQNKIFDQDLDQAAHWLKKSAEGGDGESAAMIASFYRRGISFEEDPQLSYYWIDKAFSAEYGGGPGAYSLRLADYYENGYGTNKDLVKSYFFYDLSGTAGLEGKSRISKDMTEVEIQEAIKQSRAWQEEHNTFVPSYYGLEHQSDGSYR